MGCLVNIFKIIILVLAAIGFKTVGGVDFINKFVDIDSIFKSPSQEKLQEKSAKIADFSDINAELIETYKVMRDKPELLREKMLYHQKYHNNQTQSYK